MGCPVHKLQDRAIDNKSTGRRIGSRIRRIMRFSLIAEGVLAFSLLLTGAAWYISKGAVDQIARERFGFRTEDVSALIRRRMQEQEEVLRGGVGLINSAGRVSRAQWRSFVGSLKLEKFYPGLQGYGYSLVVSPRDKTAHIDAIRSEGFEKYDINPPGLRDVYTSIVYLEPFKGRNLRAFGYDMFSEPTRRAAMERARDTGEAAVSGGVTLVQEYATDVQRGFLMYLPVYRGGQTPTTVKERRAKLIGYVYSPFRFGDLMRGILGAGDSLINFAIYDGAEMAPTTLLYDSAAGRHFEKIDFERTVRFQIGGSPWTLNFKAHVDEFSPFAPSLPSIIGFGGIAIDLLLYLIIRSLGRREKAIATKAAAMSAEIGRSSERYRAVVDTAADAIILADQRGTILSFNRAAETIFGYAAHEVTGKNVNVLMPEDQWKAHDGYLTRYLDTKDPRVVGIGRDVEGRRKDGTLFPLHLSVAEWSNGPGEIGFTAILRDITAQRNAQRALEESEYQNRLFMDCATDYAIYQLDLNHRIVKWNKGTERILGYSAEEMDGFSILKIFPESDLREDRPAYVVATAIKNGRFDTEGWRTRKDGSSFWASGVVQPILDGDKKVIGMAVVLRDATAQRTAAEMLRITKDQAQQVARLESELRSKSEAANSELKAANEGLQKFTSIVAHDLRSPLKRIDAFIDALRDDYGDKLDDEGNEILTRINRGAVRMKNMLDSMLDYSRYNAKAIHGKTADLPNVINGVIDNCDFQLHDSSIHVNVGSSAAVKGDAMLLAHVFQNLIGNSIKFRRGADLRIDIEAVQTDEGLQVSVADNGIGIEPHFADQVFEMFYRLHNCHIPVGDMAVF